MCIRDRRSLGGYNNNNDFVAGRFYTSVTDTGCMGMMALGREDLKGQLRVAEQGGIQPLVRLLRLPRTSSKVLLADVCALASFCIG